MSRDSVLSGEQALTDYFAALLDESEELELAQEINAQVIAEVSHDSQFVPQLKPVVSEEKILEVSGPDFLPIPNLDDVERLLKQLESSNPVAEIEHVEDIIEENTRKVVEELHHQEELEQQATTHKIVVEDEVQGWDVDTLDTTADEVHVAEEIKEIAEPVDTEIVEQVSEVAQSGGGGSEFGHWEGVQRTSNFQVLYFEVNGVTFAVPLDELGGIHRITELNHLIGRPKWYLGLQTNRDAQLDVVDTARWVMADKLSGDEHKESYEYIVMLGESTWGLACGQLKGTELLDCDKVRWREHVGKRPWLAGMVKEKMCALIHVEALVAMLKAGLDVKALDK
ncbi:chemotaxis protein CheW [Vibrio sp.]|nr:chemotaxis protein CheW [Vibrio sp.]